MTAAATGSDLDFGAGCTVWCGRTDLGMWAGTDIDDEPVDPRPWSFWELSTLTAAALVFGADEPLPGHGLDTDLGWHDSDLLVHGLL